MAVSSRSCIFVTACIAFISFVFIASTPLMRHVKTRLLVDTTSFDHQPFKSAKQNVWADFSKSEAQKVSDFLYSIPELNLTRVAKGNK